MQSDAGLEVPSHLRRGRHRSVERWRASGVALLDLLPRCFGHPDLASVSLLDVGCGTKLATVLVDEDIPIGRYVGVDVSREVISFLDANVGDPRFAFHHLDAHSARTNPAGRPLESFSRLPVGNERFDLISLFSVFTHLAPPEFRTMLELLRPHVADHGGLLFSLFVDVGPTAEQRAAIKREVARRREAGDPEVIRAIEERRAAGGEPGEVPDFVDRVPDKPLEEAVYSEPHARALIDGTGWEAVALHAPIPSVIQHHFVCRPV